LNKAS